MAEVYREELESCRAKAEAERSRADEACRDLAAARAAAVERDRAATAAADRAAALERAIQELRLGSQRDRELIRKLNADLNERSDSSARLMIQLHKAKVQYKQFADMQACEEPSSDAGTGAAFGDPSRRSRSPTAAEGHSPPSPSKPLNQLRPRLARRRASFAKREQPVPSHGACSSSPGSPAGRRPPEFRAPRPPGVGRGAAESAEFVVRGRFDELTTSPPAPTEEDKQGPVGIDPQGLPVYGPVPPIPKGVKLVEK